MKSRLEFTDLNLLFQKSDSKSSTDECYWESLKFLCGASLDDLMSYYKFILLVVNSFSRETENILSTIYKYCIQAENYKHLTHDCSLILSFDVVKQILAHLAGAKIHSDILTYENSYR